MAKYFIYLASTIQKNMKFSNTKWEFNKTYWFTILAVESNQNRDDNYNDNNI